MKRINIKAIFQYIRISFVMLALFTVFFGGIYPAVISIFAQVVFPAGANGSLVSDDKKVKGSLLLGQPFSSPRYFWGRPSETSPPYNASSSSGSNYGVRNPELAVALNARVEALRKADPGNNLPIPAELVTASASGLDPHITLKGALYQVSRVAKIRGLSETDLRKLVEQNVEQKQFGIFGKPRINVLKLNTALDAMQAIKNK